MNGGNFLLMLGGFLFISLFTGVIWYGAGVSDGRAACQRVQVIVPAQ